MNLELNKTQEKAYDRTTRQIREYVGSYHTIAIRIMFNCGKELTGQTISDWFRNRRVPTHIAFALYEICDEQIDPLTLCPWLAEHVVLRTSAVIKPAARKG